jgi:predicted secreted Zn-dependent protease
MDPLPKALSPDEALNHEKRHFDICEIYARKIRKAISLAQVDRKHFNEQVDYIFKKIVVDYRAAQNRYDGRQNIPSMRSNRKNGMPSLMQSLKAWLLIQIRWSALPLISKPVLEFSPTY